MYNVCVHIVKPICGGGGPVSGEKLSLQLCG
jgi:hypothetical protein